MQLLEIKENYKGNVMINYVNNCAFNKQTDFFIKFFECLNSV